MNENLMRQEKHKFTGQLVAQLEEPIGLKNLIAGGGVRRLLQVVAVASWFGEILGKHTPSAYDYAGITSNLRMIYVIFRLCSNAKRIHIQMITGKLQHCRLKQGTFSLPIL